MPCCGLNAFCRALFVSLLVALATPWQAKAMQPTGGLPPQRLAPQRQPVAQDVPAPVPVGIGSAAAPLGAPQPLAAAPGLSQRPALTDFAPRYAPFGDVDFSWMPGNYGGATRPWTVGAFAGEFRADAAYHYSLANPSDHTIAGSSEAFRHNELQLTQLGFGGDFYYKGAHGRLMTQFGVYATGTPRNDASVARGQWALADAFRYIAEGYGGYHWDALHGINLQAGLFMSFIGLWSYYNFDNWTAQPSYVSSNTPWFFQGVRAQIYINDTLKIEPWLVNGWQSYAGFNKMPGVGGQIAWRPTPWLAVTLNQYYGTDTLAANGRRRFHTDDSVMVKYYEKSDGVLSRAAASLTVDVGCEWGDGVSCRSQQFLGAMAYNRLWFLHNHLAVTVGGGVMSNPGRYLTLLPPINGASATSNSQTYFTLNPGDPFRAWDAQASVDLMPVSYATLRIEYTHRAAAQRYFAGPGGMTPPGGNQGIAGSDVAGWAPDLRRMEDRVMLGFTVKI